MSTFEDFMIDEAMRQFAKVVDWLMESAVNKVPYLMHADALKLKKSAEDMLKFKDSAHIAVDCHALLSLIEQAHSPQLGLATTKEIREEYECRMNGDHNSRADDYRTFDPTRDY